jgi:hypothetical protein
MRCYGTAIEHASVEVCKRKCDREVEIERESDSEIIIAGSLQTPIVTIRLSSAGHSTLACSPHYP